jgi:hypothetical protein
MDKNKIIVLISILFIIATIGIGYHSKNKNVSTLTEIGAFSHYSNWKIYNPVGEQFSISFPSDDVKIGSISEMGNSDNAYKNYYVEYKDINYGVARYVGKSTELSDPDMILAHNLDILLKIMEPNGQLISNDYTYYHSYRALDILVRQYDLSDKAKDIYTRSRFILVGKTFYMLGIEYTNNYNDEDYQHFINSFEIKAD